jgi:hypothetical protein
MGHAAAHSRDGAIAFVCMDWRHMGELLALARRSGEHAQCRMGSRAFAGAVDDDKTAESGPNKLLAKLRKSEKQKKKK